MRARGPYCTSSVSPSFSPPVMLSSGLNGSARATDEKPLKLRGRRGDGMRDLRGHLTPALFAERDQTFNASVEGEGDLRAFLFLFFFSHSASSQSPVSKDGGRRPETCLYLGEELCCNCKLRCNDFTWGSRQGITTLLFREWFWQGVDMCRTLA